MSVVSATQSVVFCYGSSSRLILSPTATALPEACGWQQLPSATDPRGLQHPPACSLNPAHLPENTHFIEFSLLIPCEGAIIPTGARSHRAGNNGLRVYPKRVGSPEGVCISLLGLPQQSIQTGGLKRDLISHHSAYWKSKMKCHQSWFLWRPLSVACGWLSSPHVFTWSCFCGYL